MYWHSHIHWSGNWSGKSNAARAALEQLYSTGELIIHHKKGARKFYDLAEKYLPRTLLAAPDPFPEDAAHQRWRMLRRIGAVGLMWNRPSDAWLGIPGLKADQRKDAFRKLMEEEMCIRDSWILQIFWQLKVWGSLKNLLLCLNCVD